MVWNDWVKLMKKMEGEDGWMDGRKRWGSGVTEGEGQGKDA